MGPLATADFLAKLTRLTCARRDQDHLPIVAASIPQVPDRTSAMLDGGESPLPALMEIVRLLEEAGAVRLAIPCSTAHLWYDAMAAETTLPIIHIVNSVATILTSQEVLPPASLALLATDATVAGGLYQSMLGRLGYRVHLPDGDGQRVVMDAIRNVKAGDLGSTESLRVLVRDLLEAGCSRVMLACTELPIALAGFEPARVIDTTEALAAACLNAFSLPIAMSSQV